jgi:hypothetical protein
MWYNLKKVLGVAKMKIDKFYDATCKSGDFIGECDIPSNIKVFEEIIKSKENNNCNFAKALNIMTFPRKYLNTCFLNKMRLSFEIEFQSANVYYILTFNCISIFHDEYINENYSLDKNEICYTGVELIFDRASNIKVSPIN